MSTGVGLAGIGSTVMLQKSYSGTITEPGVSVIMFRGVRNWVSSS